MTHTRGSRMTDGKHEKGRGAEDKVVIQLTFRPENCREIPGAGIELLVVHEIGRKQ